MPEPEDKRIKFCRYCDGVIEWGTEICPHCGETLKVVEFDDMEFIGTPGSLGASAPPPPSRPPVVAPIPVDDDDDVPDTVEFEALDLTPSSAGPILRPVQPPVMKPVSPPPVMKPVAKPGVKPGRKPVLKPIAPAKQGGSASAPRAPSPGRQPAPVLKPISEDPPVLKPLSDDPPVVAPLGPGDREVSVLAAMAECTVCGQVAASGGTCRSCGAKACVSCMIDANGLRVSSSPDMNRVRWGDRSRKLGPEKIRCPACGTFGVDP